MYKMIAFFIFTLFAQLYVRIGDARGKHVHDRIISQRREVWSLQTFNVVPVPPQEVSGYVCSVLEVLILIFDFGIVPTFHFFPSYLLCRGFMFYYVIILLVSNLLQWTIFY
jgi:hypothetical protein